MTYLRNLIAGLLLVFGLLGTAGAGTITDETLFTDTGTIKAEDYISHGSGDVNWISGLGDYVKWAHNFQFNPPAASISSALLQIAFFDDDNDGRWFLNYEWGFGLTESGQWAFGEIDSETYSYQVDVSYLLDGKFQVKVAGLLGDFRIDSSKLTIDYEPVAVPEPALLVFLGIGIGAASFMGCIRK